MLNKIKQQIEAILADLLHQPKTVKVRSDQRYQPSRPLGFVPRSDPNYYFLTRTSRSAHSGVDTYSPRST